MTRSTEDRHQTQVVTSTNRLGALEYRVLCENPNCSFTEKALFHADAEERGQQHSKYPHGKDI